jgi:hypothetical protein
VTPKPLLPPPIPQALVLKDLEGVKLQCEKLNAGDMYSLLAAILTNRSWDDIRNPDMGSLQTPSTEQEKTLLRTYAQRYLLEITQILNKVPRQVSWPGSDPHAPYRLGGVGGGGYSTEERE